MKNWKMTLIVGALLVFGFVSFQMTVTNTGESARQTGKYTLAIVSLLANIAIIYSHYKHPPHPKFLLLRKRKLSIRAHLISGSVEIVAGGVALFVPDPTIPAYVMAAAAFVHIATSAFQTPIVFGAKAVMIPSYIGATALHLYCAAFLIFNPASPEWVLNTFLTLNIYVWVRVFYYIFEQLGLFQDSLYSVSVLSAGLFIVPAVLGPAGNLVTVGYVLIYVFLYKALFSSGELAYQMQENDRITLIDNEARAIWEMETVGEKVTPTIENQLSESFARRVFDSLDKNDSDTLCAEEVQQILLAWKAPPQFVTALTNRIAGKDKVLSFDEFYHSLWSVGRVRNRLILAGKARHATKVTNEEQAKTVFDYLDLNQSGFLDTFELEMLLLEWGLPLNEVQEYLKQFDENKDGRISPQEFQTHFRPVWKFGYHRVLQLSGNV